MLFCKSIYCRWLSKSVLPHAVFNGIWKLFCKCTNDQQIAFQTIKHMLLVLSLFTLNPDVFSRQHFKLFSICFCCCLYLHSILISSVDSISNSLTLYLCCFSFMCTRSSISRSHAGYPPFLSHHSLEQKKLHQIYMVINFLASIGLGYELSQNT